MEIILNSVGIPLALNGEISDTSPWSRSTGSIEGDFMGRILIVILVLLSGCSSHRPFTGGELPWQRKTPNSQNPIYVQTSDHEFLWSVIADVVSNHFEIAREEPVRLYDSVLTEGRLDTKPKIAASVGEVWHADSVGLSDRIDSTFQTIRKKVRVRVVPVVGGFQIEALVHKELEDRKAPIRSQTSNANLRYTSDNDPFSDDFDLDIDMPSSRGWIPLGRDTPMEDRLLHEILYRLERPSKFIRKEKDPIRA